MVVRALMLALGLVCAGGAPLAAQLQAQGRVTLASAFVWRGLTVVNRPVVQPELTLTVGRVSGGIWSNVEPRRYQGDRVLSMLAGRRAPGFTEFDPYVEIAGKVAGADVAFGGYGYLYTHSAGYDTEPNTAELYVRATLPALPIELSANYDVHAVQGAYLEAAVEHAAPRLPALQLALRLGASLGEASGPETSFFAQDGITHVQAGASLPLTIRGLELTPTADLVLGVDRETRWVAPEQSRTAKAFIGLSVAWPAGE